jgi:hypothetical protein
MHLAPESPNDLDPKREAFTPWLLEQVYHAQLLRSRRTDGYKWAPMATFFATMLNPFASYRHSTASQAGRSVVEASQCLLFRR